MTTSTIHRIATAAIASSLALGSTAGAQFIDGATIDVNGMWQMPGPGSWAGGYWGTWTGQGQHVLGTTTQYGGVYITSEVVDPTHLRLSIDVGTYVNPIDLIVVHVEVPGLTTSPTIVEVGSSSTGTSFHNPGVADTIVGATNPMPPIQSDESAWVPPAEPGDGVRWRGSAEFFPFFPYFPGVYVVTLDIHAEPSEPVIGDLNGDGFVNGADLAIMLGAWGPCVGCEADLNGDDIVDGADLAILLGHWSP